MHITLEGIDRCGKGSLHRYLERLGNFAYIIDDMVKSSDDGAPGGTAGMPILQVLQNHVYKFQKMVM